MYYRNISQIIIQAWKFPAEKLEPDFLDVKIYAILAHFSLVWGVFVQFYAVFNHSQTFACVLIPVISISRKKTRDIVNEAASNLQCCLFS